jgi:hypothetical protein
MYWSTDWKPQPRVFFVFCSSYNYRIISKIRPCHLHMHSTVLSLYRLEINICTD